MTFDSVPSPAYSTDYKYVGDIPALGSLNLLMLARSFDQLNPTSLDQFFPEMIIPERTITIEQIIDSLSVAPIVQPGRPSGAFMPETRIQQRVVSPAYIREDEFIDQYLINQLRRPGTYNEAYRPEELIARRVQFLMQRRNRVRLWFQVQALARNSISYTDPRTKTSINVGTGIPARNLWNYKFISESSASAGSVVSGIGGGTYTLMTDCTGNQRRDEALFFVNSTDSHAAVPWTHPDADIVRTVRMLKAWNRKTNRNEYTHLIWSADLEAQLLANNRFLKAYAGQVANFTITTTTGTGNNARTTQGTAISTAEGTGATGPLTIQFGPGGEISSIAGLQVVRIDSLFTNPTTNKVEDMWPVNKVVLLSAHHPMDRSEPLGYTAHCVGEAPDGRPGMWIASMPFHSPPSPPSWVIQLGDAFLPFAVHPEWITILTVCEEDDVSVSKLIQADIGAFNF